MSVCIYSLVSISLSSPLSFSLFTVSLFLPPFSPLSSLLPHLLHFLFLSVCLHVCMFLHFFLSPSFSLWLSLSFSLPLFHPPDPSFSLISLPVSPYLSVRNFLCSLSPFLRLYHLLQSLLSNLPTSHLKLYA